MGGQKKGKSPADTRKPKHSNDQARPSKDVTSKGKGMRDAATVRPAAAAARPLQPSLPI